MSLQKRNVPLLANGGIDTKTNPKLVQPPGLLELENMYELRSGELMVRNGFAPLNVTVGQRIGPTGAAACIFQTANGGLGAISRSRESVDRAWLLRYGPNRAPGWSSNNGNVPTGSLPYGNTKATVDGLSSMLDNLSSDVFDPDVATNNGLQLATWLGSTVTMSQVTDTATGRSVYAQQQSSTSITLTKCCAAGTRWLCQFWLTNTNDISLSVYDTNNGGSVVNYTLAAGLVHAAQRFYDIMPIPGGDTVAVAFRAAAGGITLLIVNASTGAVTAGPSNIAGADATLTLGFLEDLNFSNGTSVTGSVWIATAGTVSGVVVRSFANTNLAAGSTNVIDATATANVRNITGHIDTGSSDYTVLWDVSGAITTQDVVKKGKWSGASTVTTLAPTFSLYSRTFYAEDGNRHFIGAYASVANPAYAVLPVSLTSAYIATSQPRCMVLNGEAGGRRQNSAHLASVAPRTSFSAPGNISVGRPMITAVARKRSVVTPGANAVQLRSVSRVTLSPIIPYVMRPRELGGTVFIPGGNLLRDDGTLFEVAGFQLPPEAPTGVSSATGSMTASGAYSYRLIYRRTDATGRIFRSAGSLIFSVTLGAGDGRVTLTIQNPALVQSEFTNTIMEIYRAGPASAGSTTYNKVGEAFASSLTGWATTVSFVDTMSDTNAAAGEVAYFTGGVLENFPAPSCSLLEVAGNRVWVASAENPSELWYSKEYKPGGSIGFNALLTLRLDGDSRGAITALASMDGRIVAFKDQAIWVVYGDGPNDNGQGSFTAQCVSRSVGTMIPASVVETPVGIMFQSAKGIYLLDRGMSLSYIGAPVEQYTLGGSPYTPLTANPKSVIGAALVERTNQVRFMLYDGRTLVYDFDLKRWATFTLPAAIALSVTSTQKNGWCYMLSGGDVYTETEGATTDNGATIVPRVSFPHLTFGGVAGYQRLYGIVFTVQGMAACTLSVDAEFDYSGSVTGTPKTKAIAPPPSSSFAEWTPPEGQAKCSACRPVLTLSGAAAGGSFRLTAATATVGVKRGSRAAEGDRMT